MVVGPVVSSHSSIVEPHALFILFSGQEREKRRGGRGEGRRGERRGGQCWKGEVMVNGKTMLIIIT